jgi:hypothetical protein
MVYSKKEREQYNSYRIAVCERLGIRELDYNAFRRIGQALRQQYENRCNTDISDETYESLVNPLYEKADKLAKRLELFIFYQTDPRGGTIYLDKKPIPENNYTIANLVY